MHWKTILVPHDFSSSANHAAALARNEAKLHGGKILLLHVIDLPSQLPPNAAIVPTETGAPISVRDYAVSSAETHLQDLANRLAKDDVEATPFIRVGSPVEQINLFVEENAVDLIVMGTHGHTGIRALMAGSITEKVVRSARVPVLTVRHPD
ncbi:MAG: universal stress protein [Myxococcales bacterium]|nr:universal stress protein [Myxococcales bacterium]